MMIRIVLADDHPIYRDGVARSMADAGDLEIVGQAGDGEAAADLVVREKPDVVLLDISMPKGGGIAALTRIMAMPEPPRVAMLTASEADDDLMQAIKLGAMGYILKGIGASELVELVRDLHAGRSYVSPGLAGRLLIAMRRRETTPPEPTPLDDLSKREEEILKLVAFGKSNREVGDALELQEKTVKHYMTSILEKLHVRNRVEAAVLARQHLKP
ncbi:MAG: response regulator transcription factor [Candidatus Saccharibacteria bacterium]|nr:response regulator transcription factor [Pseudorhodobacter sp.]